jgi:Acyltransferase family
MTSGTPASVATERQQDLDLMRAFVVGGLVFYHTAYLFPLGFSADSDLSHLVLTAFVLFAQLWGMPLLFVIAGSGIWHSLRARAPGGFVRERLRRLLVPLLTGMLLVVTPLSYLSMLADHEDPGSYWEFLGRFFNVRPVASFPAFLEPVDPQVPFHLAHLWFLYYLLVWSMLLLPVFLCLRSDAGQRLIDRVARLCQGPFGTLPLALPVAIIEAALGTWKLGGWQGCAYLAFLVYGFLLAGDRRLREVIHQRWRQSLVAGMALLPVLYLIATTELGHADRVLAVDPDPWSVGWRFLKATAGWALTVGILGLAPAVARWLSSRRPAVARGEGGSRAMTSYAREAVLPFYILHQTPIVILGYYILQTRTSVLFKYVAISLAGLGVTILVYELFVRRANAIRVLFGLPRR